MGSATPHLPIQPLQHTSGCITRKKVYELIVIFSASLDVFFRYFCGFGDFHALFLRLFYNVHEMFENKMFVDFGINYTRKKFFLKLKIAFCTQSINDITNPSDG